MLSVIKWRPWFVRFAVAIIVFVFVHGCKSESFVTRSFCYWKTSFDLTDADDSLMNRLQVNHLYLRLFDVDWNPYENEAQPVGSINRWWNGKLGCNELTPSIFITNTVMEKSTEQQLDSLAVLIQRRMNTIFTEYANAFASHLVSDYQEKHAIDYHDYDHIRDSVFPIAHKAFFNRVRPEVLIDCDWSEHSRDKFFHFLGQLKKQLPDYEVGITLRLWQFKFREKAGIPPVSRCLLMCYNMQSLANYQAGNSIGSAHEISQYLTQPDYPVNLDIALPLFGWAVLYRGQTYKGLISDQWFRDHVSDTSLLHLFAPNRYQFTADQVIGNTYVRYGDELRIEQVSPKELGDIVQYLKHRITLAPNSRVTFFAWDTAYIHHYGIENLTNYYRTLRK